VERQKATPAKSVAHVYQPRSQDFTLGGTEAPRLHFFIKKTPRPFLVVAVELSVPQNTSDRKNSVNLLKKQALHSSKTVKSVYCPLAMPLVFTFF